MTCESKAMTIEELIDELELMFWASGKENFKITELFPNNGVHTYNVSRLIMEDDEEFVYSHDTDNIILKGRYVLMAFLKECLVSVCKTILNGIYVCMLEFIDGDITIEVA